MSVDILYLFHRLLCTKRMIFFKYCIRGKAFVGMVHIYYNIDNRNKSERYFSLKNQPRQKSF